MRKQIVLVTIEMKKCLQMNLRSRCFFFVFVFFGFQIAFARRSSPASQEFKLFFEKVYLHLDRSFYAPGDDIWFKACLVNAQNNLEFKASNIPVVATGAYEVK